jgi:hypothetical protein
VLWISAHADLHGDPRLGPEQQQRFLPTRFTIDCRALDARGFASDSLACPHCHLPIPRSVLEIESLFISILGTPACGKSYFLTAMTWEMRRIAPLHFALSFTDADPVSNRGLNENEELLFLNRQPEELVPLADLIAKTELQGQLYDTVLHGNQTVSYPRPLLFAVLPTELHRNHGAAKRLARLLCLYDNAGEHFLAGQDTASAPVTQHLAQSKLLFFLFDPLQDQRFRYRCQAAGITPPSMSAARNSRQESVLMEAAARVRRYTGLPAGEKHGRPLIVVLTKVDAWDGLLGAGGLRHEPWVLKEGIMGLDLALIAKRSQILRTLMLETCPEVVTAAEGFAKEVVYVAVSALGSSPVAHPQSKTLVVQPKEIKPACVTTPLLYGLWRTISGLVPAVKTAVETQTDNTKKPTDQADQGRRQRARS